MYQQEKPLIFRLNDGGGPDLVRQVFLERGWSEYDEESQDKSDWNIWWKTSRFKNSDVENLLSWQRLNHYPKTTALTKKDTLARNLKRMKGIYGASVYNFSPVAYNLPNDYTRFVADYTKLKQKEGNKKLYWICKPADLSRGRGIFIFNDLSNLQYDCNAVVQKYISNPLLISNYKFDLRIYVCVPSFHPLYAYICQEGMVRFSTEKYDLQNLDNVYSHLTNTSINKYSPSYTTEKQRVGSGCKWTLTQLRHYFHQNNIDDRQLWARVTSIVILTLIVQVPLVSKVNNCFELYGFDIILDENLKPWLLEVNFSPALNADCQADISVKKSMLHDLMQMLNFKDVDIERGKNVRKCTLNQEKSKSNSRSVWNDVSLLPKIIGEHQGDTWLNIHKDCKNYVCDDSESTDSDPDNPVKPGCGLPSVQLQKRRANTMSSSSGCSSANSSTHCSIGYSNTSSQSICTTNNTEMFEQIFDGMKKKEHSKSSLLSAESSVSCYSSENSDLHLISEAKPLTPPASDELENSSTSIKSKVSEVLCRYTKPPPQLNLDSEKQKSLERYKKASQPSIPIVTMPKHPSLVRDHKLNRWSTRTSIVLPSHHDHPNLMSRRQSCGSLDSPLSYHKIKAQLNNNKHTPKTANKSGRMGNLFTPIKMAKRKSGPKLRIGDFFLVFPFNEATKKVAGKMDARVVAREVQRFIRAGSNEVKGVSTSGNSNSVRSAVAGETINSVCDFPMIWGPIRPTGP